MKAGGRITPYSEYVAASLVCSIITHLPIVLLTLRPQRGKRKKPQTFCPSIEILFLFPSKIPQKFCLMRNPPIHFKFHCRKVNVNFQMYAVEVVKSMCFVFVFGLFFRPWVHLDLFDSYIMTSDSSLCLYCCLCKQVPPPLFFFYSCSFQWKKYMNQL